MSISLTVSYHDHQRKRELIPVATQDTFFNCWLPACKQLQLKWIPLFETGYPAIILDLETLPEVVDELRRLAAFFVENDDPHNSECIAQFMIERIERLVSVMGDAIQKWEEIEYISV